jgi:hypothetical protein
MNNPNRAVPTNRASRRLSRLRVALCVLGCLFVVAAFFSTSARLDDVRVAQEERVAIFTWTDLKFQGYLGGALCSFVAAIVLSVWPRPKPESTRLLLETVGVTLIALPVLFIAYFSFAVYGHMHPITAFCKSVPTSVTQSEFTELAGSAGFHSVFLGKDKILVPNNGGPFFRNGCEATFDHDRLVNKEEVDAD